MSWSKQQARDFAKQIMFSSGSAWWALVDDIREAILDAKVMSVVLGQDSDAVSVSEIRDLRTAVAVAMMWLGLTTPTGDLVSTTSPGPSV